jgi:hypothetical protein
MAVVVVPPTFKVVCKNCRNKLKYSKEDIEEVIFKGTDGVTHVRFRIRCPVVTCKSQVGVPEPRY